MTGIRRNGVGCGAAGGCAGTSMRVEGDFADMHGWPEIGSGIR